MSAATEPKDLALLVEVAELYCLVSPPGRASSVHAEPWHPLLQAIEVCPYPVLASFAATCGEALLSITKYLVEDVLLVASGVAGARASAAGTGSSTGSSDVQRVRDNNSSCRRSSSSGEQRPRMGGRNPKVTLNHRVTWAQHSITILGLLMSHQDCMDPKGLADCSQLEQSGEAPAV
jgi:hypothetical protein